MYKGALRVEERWRLCFFPISVTSYTRVYCFVISELVYIIIVFCYKARILRYCVTHFMEKQVDSSVLTLNIPHITKGSRVVEILCSENINAILFINHHMAIAFVLCFVSN